MAPALADFSRIISRQDFGIIADSGRISRILSVIASLQVSTGSEAEMQAELRAYLAALGSFAGWISADAIKEFRAGRDLCAGSLSRACGCLSEPAQRRAAISKGYVRTFAADLVNGLSLMAKGLKRAFEEDPLATNLTADQMRLYLLDANAGLARRFSFNSRGDDSFVRKAARLTRQELAVAVALLRNPGREAESKNGWVCLGRGKCPVRILLMPRGLRSPLVAYLFRLSEHDAYERFLSGNSGKGWRP